MKKVSKKVKKFIYLSKEVLEETEKLDLYTNECRGNFSLYAETAIREKNKREGKK